MKIGYARVSTDEQSPELQIDALKSAGCERIYVDTVSGAKSDRPELEQLKSILRKGDTLVVWRLDRLGRSLKDLITWMNELVEQEIHFESLQEKIDTATPTGKLVFHLFGAIAEFERDLIRERTHAGLVAARARGRKGGRKPKLSTSQRKVLAQLYREKKHSIAELTQMFSISRRLLYHIVAEG
ncbi:MAG: recombinase family protein [Akkermansiaceae bacterium]